MYRLFPAITIISSWILFRTPVLLHLGKNGTTIRQQNMQAIQAPSLLGASLKPHRTKRKRTQMPVKQRSDMLTYFFVHFSAQLCPTTCAWVLDLKNWTSQLETFVHAGTNGDKRCLDTAELLIVNYQPWSTLVNLGQLGQPRSAAFSSSLTGFSFYAWPSNEAKYSHEVHLTLEGIEGTLRHMERMEGSAMWCGSAGPSQYRCLFFLFLFTSASFRRVRFRLATAWLLQNENGRESKLIIDCQVYLKYPIQYT